MVSISCGQNKREELSTCWSKVQNQYLNNGRDARSRSKAPSSNSCNHRKSIRGKKLRLKLQLFISFRLIRTLLSIILKQPLLIRLVRILLVTSKTCRAFNLTRKKRRPNLASQMWLWLKNLMKKAASSKTSLVNWRGPNENEESHLSES